MRSRRWLSGGVAAALGIVAVAAIANAGAAPALIPAIGAPTSCIRYASKFAVTGDSFSPGSKVTISAPADRYAPPNTSGIQFGDDNTLTVGASGSFKVVMTAPKVTLGSSRAAAYQPRAIFAYGVNQQVESVAYVLVGTTAVCRELQRLSVLARFSASR